MHYLCTTTMFLLPYYAGDDILFYFWSSSYCGGAADPPAPGIQRRPAVGGRRSAGRRLCGLDIQSILSCSLVLSWCISLVMVYLSCHGVSFYDYHTSANFEGGQ